MRDADELVLFSFALLIQQRAKRGKPNADLMSQSAGRIERCFGTVM